MAKRKKISRRDFLKTGATGAAGAVGTGVLGRGVGAEQPATDEGPVRGPGAVPVTLTVNGTRHALRVEPRVTLLDALRDRLTLTGAKRACDRGSCGACTVLLDGKAVYACTMLAIEAQRGTIETIEGLGGPGAPHPIQAAFVEHDAQQCGFCTPGFVMACKALLDRHPAPTAGEIEQGLGGNLCRCGTYAGIRSAVRDAAGKLADGRTDG